MSLHKSEFNVPNGNGGYDTHYFKTSKDQVVDLADATESESGLMSASDKARLNTLVSDLLTAAIPEQSGSITYDGTTKTPTWNNYDGSKMTISGTTSATETGTYTATFTLNNGLVWSDNTTAAKNITWTIGQAVGTVSATPSQIEAVCGVDTTFTLTVPSTGAITVESEDTGIVQVAVNGTTVTVTPVAVGGATVTVNVAADNNYSAASTTVPCTVVKGSFAKPTLSTSSFTYDGTEKTPTFENFNATYMTKGGTCTATNAGSYTATVSLKDTTNMEWSDGTTADVSLSWGIEKAAGSITASTDTLEVDNDDPTATFTVTTTGDGEVSVSSSDSTIATASISGYTVTVTGVASGDATITVTLADGTNYTGGSDTVSVAATMGVTSISLEDDDWSTVSAIAQAGTGADYYNIGDTKSVAVSGTVGILSLNQTMYVYILDFNHPTNKSTADNNIIFGCFKSAASSGVDTALVDSKYSPDAGWAGYTDGTKTFTMNHWGNYNYGGWKGCDLRYDILGATNTAPSGYGSAKATSCTGYDATGDEFSNPKSGTMLAALPSDLRAVMRTWTKYVDAKGNSSNADANISATVDAISLLAEFEVFGSRSQANQYEQNHQKQMAYYANGNSKVRYKYNSTSGAVYWWESSARYDYANDFCYVNSNGNADRNDAYFSLALAPAFKV